MIALERLDQCLDCFLAEFFAIAGVPSARGGLSSDTTSVDRHQAGAARRITLNSSSSVLPSSAMIPDTKSAVKEFSCSA